MKRILKVIPLHTDENKLITKAVNGSREAQHAIFKKYAPKMLSVCRYYISDLHYAEDVMITAFHKVLTKLYTFRKDGSFEGWIRRIMVRECISFLRSRKAMQELDEQYTEIAYDNTTAELAFFETEDIQRMVDELPEGYKTVFLMFAIEGYSHREIAELLDISESTSKSQLFKARKLLQERIVEFKNREHERGSVR